ncbi:uncharacterized protein AB675_4551 [Cyphellophora attinorum]|uniref:Uncharacterized protein n=1 Tax=Cyphellophora attinorum TaxID=1664694 RepID=A0A0N1H330_9EURO|nr:uncharacterized protein AB675_4551 [Phialophora attinorum]KPI39126.1 hypothetical protein AB675_4551 [Phialophora attinorum]
MKSINAIAIALLSYLMQVSSCLPAQVSNTTFADLGKRQCIRAGDENNYQCDEKLPKLSEIVARIRDTSDYGLADDQHVAVFWTNLGDSAQMGTAMSITEILWMQGWLESRRLRWYWWFEHINLNWRKAQVDWINNNNIQYQEGQGHNPLFTFDVCSYQALAAAAIHPHAYLFTKKGVDWRQDSMWNQVEFWQLTKNKNIKRIYRVDPRPWDVAGILPVQMCSHSSEEILWDRDRGDAEIEPVDTCRVP